MNELLRKEKAININRYFLFPALIVIINILVFFVFTLAYADSLAPAYVLQWGGGQFSRPIGICSDPQGNIYVTDSSNHCIQKFTQDGVFITKWGTFGSGNGQFYSPFGICSDSQGNIYVTDVGNHCIQKFTKDGVFITKWGTYGFLGNGQFCYPYDICSDPEGNIYVAEWYNHRIQKFTRDGTFITKWGTYGSDNGQFCYPTGICSDPEGNIYVAEWNNRRIQKFTRNGVFITKWGTYGSGDGQFSTCRGICSDPEGNIYVIDYYNNRIQKFTKDGVFITKWGSKGLGNGQFWDPTGICSDPQGNIYVVDSDSCRIQKFSFPGGGGEEGEITITPDISTLMLGEKLTFSATQNQQPIDVCWTTRAIDNIESPLFPNNIGVFFDSQTETISKDFLTVHLGEGEIIATAIINGEPVQAIEKITVVKPDKLGTTYNQYDSEIITAANDTGILPQYIKSHIYKESYKKFNPKSYRYEPGYDFGNMQSKKTKAPYSNYALEEGAGVNEANKAPRNKYSIDTNWVFPQEIHIPNIRKIQDSDNDILCSNIFYNNDAANAKENWSVASPKAITKLKKYWDTKKEDFTAQTIISSSYGLMQMMYDVAVDEGQFGEQDPIGLFDPEKQLKVAGGIYVFRFSNWKKPRPPIYYPDNYMDENQWEEEWVNLFQKWNRGEKGYGKKVIDQSKDFLPISN